ncbi:sigma-70 family RNA polymerase sigma factor [Sporanaerobium hydrogeniformans]|uniref:sigma-70 family RNA polymerase sigma factor n=1 Tax=Sporanaerobium hydrogeniformans TaxID=3072179 RepID=UPI0015D49481|nr:sigma-70 family RNA polymerase sigma factor [Sporanaerobium hydrogeniformans]
MQKKFMRETLLWGYEKEDLEQECYLLLVKCLERFEEGLGVPFESYYKIQLYGWRANENRKKREYTSLNDEIDRMVLEKKDEGVDVEGEVVMRIGIEGLLEKLGDLGRTERAIIKRHYLEGRKLTELAKELHLPYSTLKNKKRKIAKKLATLCWQTHIER